MNKMIATSVGFVNIDQNPINLIKDELIPYRDIRVSSLRKSEFVVEHVTLKEGNYISQSFIETIKRKEFYDKIMNLEPDFEVDEFNLEQFNNATIKFAENNYCYDDLYYFQHKNKAFVLNKDSVRFYYKPEQTIVGYDYSETLWYALHIFNEPVVVKFQTNELMRVVSKEIKRTEEYYR